MRWARPRWAAARLPTAAGPRASHEAPSAGPSPALALPKLRKAGKRDAAREEREAYARLLQAVGVRVSVVGTRGRGSLARMAAAALRRRGLSVHSNVGTAGSAPAESQAGMAGWFGRSTGWEDEAKAVGEALAAGPVQALVLRNPATTAAAQRAFHEKALRPHYVLLPNVRRDVRGLRPASRDALARDWVRSVTPGATLVSGEGSPAVRAAIRRECERRQVQLVEAIPLRNDVPGLEAVSVLDAFLRHRFQAGLDPAEHDALRKELEQRFRWAPSALPGVRWFDGSGIDDPDSARLVLNHLQSARRQPVTLVAHLRRDHPGLARALVPLLEEFLAAPDLRQVFLSGPWAQAVADRLPDWRSQVHVVPATSAGATRLVRRLAFESQGGAVFLLWDDRSEWPRDLAASLQKGVSASPAQRPARTDAVPKRIARPIVAAARDVVVADLSPFAPVRAAPAAPAPPAPPPPMPAVPPSLAAVSAVTAVAVAAAAAGGASQASADAAAG